MAGPVEPLTTTSPAVPAAPASDWTVQVADTIESVVTSVRDKTTVPAETVARALVYGILIAAMGTTAMILAVIGVVRLLDNWLVVWHIYAGMGAIFLALGMLLWRRRRPKAAR